MDKKYCENCRHIVRAEEHEHYEDKVAFGRCGKFLAPSAFHNVSMAFDTSAPMLCYVARAEPKHCGPEAKGYEELT